LAHSYKYRKYEPGDEEEIVNILKKTFPKWSNRTIEYWKWKHIETPSKICTYVAVNGDKIIGILCDIVLKLKLGDKTVNYIYGDDTATDPEYRGRGVYTNLYKYVHSDRINYGTFFNLWMTENPTLFKSASKYGSLPFPFSVSHMVKINNLEKYLNNRGINTIQNRIGLYFLKKINSVIHNQSKPKKSDPNLTISTIEQFDERVDEFWEKVKEEYSYILVKNQDFLNWRYCSDNSDKYIIRLATRGDNILGFCVLRYMKNKDDLDGIIMELLAPKENVYVVDSMIDDALEQFEQIGVNSVNCQVIHGHPYNNILSQRGFIDVSRAHNSVIFYHTNDPDFDHNVFSKKNPNEIYFNLY
jgi:hypothetical protein